MADELIGLIPKEDSYAVNIAELKKTLENHQLAENLNAGFRLFFGPTYKARSSACSDIEIKTVLLECRGGLNRKPKNEELIAFSSEREVLGFRKSFFYWDYQRKIYINRGYIYTGNRATGISTLIESSHVDLLQRLANQYDQPIEWVVINANAYTLKEEEKRYATTQDKSIDDIAMILKRREEQDRWGNLYDVKFALKKEPGSGEERIQLFKPQRKRLTSKPLTEDVELIENVFLGKKGRRLEAIEIERITMAEKSALQVKRREEFNLLMHSL